MPIIFFEPAFSLKVFCVLGDPQLDLVRHFIIEPTAKGVQLKGSANEPPFGQHIHVNSDNFRNLFLYFIYSKPGCFCLSAFDNSSLFAMQVVDSRAGFVRNLELFHGVKLITLKVFLY